MIHTMAPKNKNKTVAFTNPRNIASVILSGSIKKPSKTKLAAITEPLIIKNFRNDAALLRLANSMLAFSAADFVLPHWLQ